MKLGMGSNTQQTQKHERVKVQNDIRTSIHVNKQIPPIFNCVTPVTQLLANNGYQNWTVLASISTECQYCMNAYVPCITSDITAHWPILIAPDYYVQEYYQSLPLYLNS